MEQINQKLELLKADNFQDFITVSQLKTPRSTLYLEILDYNGFLNYFLDFKSFVFEAPKNKEMAISLFLGLWIDQLIRRLFDGMSWEFLLTDFGGEGSVSQNSIRICNVKWVFDS